jgi:hypothetical protein
VIFKKEDFGDKIKSIVYLGEDVTLANEKAERAGFFAGLFGCFGLYPIAKFYDNLRQNKYRRHKIKVIFKDRAEVVKELINNPDAERRGILRIKIVDDETLKGLSEIYPFKN